MSTDPLNDPALPDLLAKALEIRDQGQEPDLQRLCADRPELEQAVRATLDTSLRLPGLQEQAASFDLIDRNPQTFVDIPKAVEQDYQPAEQRVYLGGRRGSFIEMSVAGR